jgi:hypothetical protein
MVLRKLFGPRREEVTGDWRKLHNFTICIANIIGEIKSWMRGLGHVV